MITLAKVFLITGFVPFTGAIVLILLGVFEGDGRQLGVGVMILCISFLMFFLGYCGVTLDEE